MSGNFEVIDQEVIGRTINGMDYGAASRVLARTHTQLLVWIRGSMGRGYHATYHPAQLRIVPRHEHGHRQLIGGLICEGERFHARVFKKYAQQIDQQLGDGFHALLELNKTVVVGDNESFAKGQNEMPLTGQEFGYKDVMEKRAIRERLLNEGLTDPVELHFAVIREQEASYQNAR
jgi:hypothetical protein